MNPYYDRTKPHHTPDGFRDPQATLHKVSLATVLKWRWRAWRQGLPPAAKVPTPVVAPALDRLNAAAGSSATWIGHSSMLVRSGGLNVLTDPVFSHRASPVQFLGPRRFHAPPIALDELPPIRGVLLSHDHYDHLDVETIWSLARTQRCSFFVPLGVGAHLRHWGIAPERIVELDWDGEGAVGELRIVCTPARHFSGRFLTRNTTLWSSWAMIGPRHRAFFGGDTGYTGSFADIGEAHGPFDLTLMPVGAYHPGWPDIHMNPEEAVRAHLDVTDAGRGVFVPIHWATFRLAPHPWSEPVERLLAAARPAGVTVVVPMPGAQVRPGSVDLEDDWWQL